MPAFQSALELARIHPDGTRRVYRVLGTRGLRLDVRPGGAMSWIIWYRTKAGRPRTHTLGRYPEMSLKAARLAAKRIVAHVDLERDPHGEKLAARHAAVEAKRRVTQDAHTIIQSLTEACLGSLPLRPKTAKEWRRLARAEIVPAFGERQAATLTRAEIRDWTQDIARRPAPYTANRAFEVLRRVYSWSVENDLLPGTPFVGLKRPAPEESSDRVLGAEEIRALLLALDAMDEDTRTRFELAPDGLTRPYTDAMRLLLLTGVRRDMVLGMRRSELEDLEGKEPRWTIPGGFAGRSKSGRPHVVPLSTQALRIVRRRLKEIDLDTLFPPNRIAEAEFMTWSSRFIRELREKTAAILGAEMPRWTVHNLRHTIGTHMREDLGVSSEVVSLILGHTPPGPRITRVYDRAELLPERRSALVAWGGWLDRLKADEGQHPSVSPTRRKKRGSADLPLDDASTVSGHIAGGTTGARE
jgi:integrase